MSGDTIDDPLERVKRALEEFEEAGLPDVGGIPLRVLGARVILSESADEKAALTVAAYRHFTSLEELELGEPRNIGEGERRGAAVDGLVLMHASRLPNIGKGGSEKSRAMILHALVHVELAAVDIAWDLIVRNWQEESELLPMQFFLDMLEVAYEEAKHYLILRSRLKELVSPEGKPYDYGSFPAHEGIWNDALRTASSLRERLALEHLTHEARGVDVCSLSTIPRLRRGGDEASARLLEEVVLVDEIDHVRKGLKYFSLLVNGARTGAGAEAETVRCFHETLVRVQGYCFSKGPFATELRRKAGLPDCLYLPPSSPQHLEAGAEAEAGAGAEAEAEAEAEAGAGAGAGAGAEAGAGGVGQRVGETHRSHAKEGEKEKEREEEEMEEKEKEREEKKEKEEEEREEESGERREGLAAGHGAGIRGARGPPLPVLALALFLSLFIALLLPPASAADQPLAPPLSRFERDAWTLFDSLVAAYPERPSEAQQAATASLLSSLSALYPDPDVSKVVMAEARSAAGGGLAARTKSKEALKEFVCDVKRFALGLNPSPGHKRGGEQGGHVEGEGEGEGRRDECDDYFVGLPIEAVKARPQQKGTCDFGGKEGGVNEWLQGKTSLRAGAMTLLIFVSQRCLVCHEVLPKLDRLYRAYRRNGLNVVAIHSSIKGHTSTYEDRQAMLAFFKRRKIAIPLVDMTFKVGHEPVDDEGNVDLRTAARMPVRPSSFFREFFGDMEFVTPLAFIVKNCQPLMERPLDSYLILGLDVSIARAAEQGKLLWPDDVNEPYDDPWQPDEPEAGAGAGAGNGADDDDDDEDDEEQLRSRWRRRRGGGGEL